MTATIAQPQDSRHPWTVSRQSIGWLVFLFAAFLITLSGWVPWRVEYPNETLDTSWLLGLKWAHLHKIDFGTSFVFTYGPWGFALQGYDPATFSTMVAVWASFAAAFFFALIVVCRNSRLPWWARVIWMTAVVLLFSSNITQDVRMLSLSWMLLLVHFRAGGKAAEICKVVLVIAMALAGLVKFTMTLMAVATLTLIAIQQIVEIFFSHSGGGKISRIFATIRNPLIFTLAYLALWLLAGQRFSSLPLYVSHSIEISSSYDRTQQLVAPNEFSSIAIFLSCAIALLALILIAHWRRWLVGAFVTAGVALCIFLIFKEGYVRHDGHELHATAGLLLLALLWSFPLWKSLNWIARSVAIAMIVGCVALCWRTFSKYDAAGLPREMGRVLTEFPAHAGTALSWMAGHCNMQPSYDAEIQALYEDSADVPAVKGTADIYPWNAAMLIARDQDYRPRPVFQSYMVSTPALSEINANFLRSTQAPDWIYFDFASIDDRYPSMDDALSWPELLTRYNLRDLSADATIYERSQFARTYQIIPGPDQTATLGDDIAVPPTDDFIWARIDIRQTALGKLKEEAFKSTPIDMEVQTADGKVGTCHILPDVARAGFLLSPRVLDRNEFATLYSNEWKTQLADQFVTRIRIKSTGKTGLLASYQPTIHYSFDHLQFPRLDLSAVPGFQSYIGLRYILHHSWMLDAEAPSGIVRVSNHQFGLAVIGRSQVMVVPLAPPTSVHVGFGMVDASFLSDPKTAGVMFLVFTIKADGTAVPLWGRMLNPAAEEKDRGYQTADVSLPPDTGKIVLETAPVVDGPINACYWGEVQFH